MWCLGFLTFFLARSFEQVSGTWLLEVFQACVKTSVLNTQLNLDIGLPHCLLNGVNT